MATTKAAIDAFVHGKTIALVGISASGKGFGNAAYKELKNRGYRVLPVHPSASTVQGDPCWPSLARLPEPVERLLVVTPPAASESIVKNAAAAGIRQVWLQQGAESPAAIQACEDQGLQVVHGHCILMFLERPGFHGIHKWVWRVLGKIPKA
jgi:predicted CoA-binding protein